MSKKRARDEEEREVDEEKEAESDTSSDTSSDYSSDDLSSDVPSIENERSSHDDDEVTTDSDQDPLDDEGSDPLDNSRPSTPPREMRNKLCIGCEDCSCLQAIKKLDDVPNDLEAYHWFFVHGFFVAAAHQHTRDFVHETNFALRRTTRCWTRVEDDKRCGAHLQVTTPYFPSRGKLSFSNKMKIWWLLARGTAIQDIHSVVRVNKNTVTATMLELQKKITEYNKRHIPSFHRVAVDETFMCKRKYQRGRRQGKEKGFWFVTATTKQRTAGDTGTKITYWESFHGKKRDKQNLTEFIDRIRGGNSRIKVWTDGWAGYDLEDKSKYTKHIVVPHSVDGKPLFANRHGETTNEAEGAHSVIKRRMRKQFGRARDHVEINEKIQFCTLMYDVPLKRRASVLFNRMRQVAAWK
jgi:hypothetical protein